jgi:ankyrin repeat protein
MRRLLFSSLIFVGVAIFFISASCFSSEDLEKAAYDGDKAKVIEILQSKPDVNHRDSFGGTALHAAIFQKDVSIAALLLDYGFDPNAKGLKNGYTPLHDAVWANNVEAAELLLARGAAPAIKNKDGLSAYELAVKDGKEAIAGCIKTLAKEKGINYR